MWKSRLVLAKSELKLFRLLYIGGGVGGTNNKGGRDPPFPGNMLFNSVLKICFEDICRLKRSNNCKAYISTKKGFVGRLLELYGFYSLTLHMKLVYNNDNWKGQNHQEFKDYYKLAGPQECAVWLTQHFIIFVSSACVLKLGQVHRILVQRKTK